MRVFDVHVHIFPEKIAEKASRAIGKFYGIEMGYDGTLDTALRLMDEGGIEAFCAHSVATTPEQCAHINQFILEAHGRGQSRIVPFAAIHPGLPKMENYVDSVVAAGFRGVKIHPDIQNFPLDRPDVMDMIGCVAGRLPLLIHTGDCRYDNSGPEKMAKVLDAFPKLTAICAHLAGYSQWDDAVRLLAHRDIYVDTSSSLFALPPERARLIIRAFGAEKTLFGSDYPMWNPGEELQRFLALNLSEEENRAILWDNAARLFSLT